MSEYTAEDFAQANLATLGSFGAARRVNTGDTGRWMTNDLSGELSDEHMARAGWSPVREANGRRDRNTYVDHIQEQDRIIRDRNDQIEWQDGKIEDLVNERDELQAAMAAPLSLDSLREEWENAEQADECRKGDLLIRRPDSGGYYIIYPAAKSDAISDARILSRAPQREPWADLADALWDEGVQSDTEGIARALHERGVRVTGGDES